MTLSKWLAGGLMAALLAPVAMLARHALASPYPPPLTAAAAPARAADGKCPCPKRKPAPIKAKTTCPPKLAHRRHHQARLATRQGWGETSWSTREVYGAEMQGHGFPPPPFPAADSFDRRRPICRPPGPPPPPPGWRSEYHRFEHRRGFYEQPYARADGAGPWASRRNEGYGPPPPMGREDDGYLAWPGKPMP
ncbi:MAG TPA: hypothetical protein VGS12_15800 [Caulobacteraceae bacterium]|nr:hypothetical protein [Caulobacteraceae bacterium]